MKTVTDNNTIEQVLQAAWLTYGHNSLEEFTSESNWVVLECDSSVEAEAFSGRDDCYVVGKYLACF
jgi:hypothetical protein